MTDPAEPNEQPSPQGADQPHDRLWLNVIASLVDQVIAGTFGRESSQCIFGTHVLIKVLDRFGVAARPTPVWVTAQNIEAAQLADQGVPVDQWPASAWAVGVSAGPPGAPAEDRPGHWNGHLVAVVRAKPGDQFGAPRLLLDPTARQFDRPAKSIRFDGPVVFGITSGKIWTPRDPLLYRFPISEDDPRTGIIWYYPMSPGEPSAQSWKNAPDWVGGSNMDLIDGCVQAILDRLPETLEAARAVRD